MNVGKLALENVYVCDVRERAWVLGSDSFVLRARTRVKQGNYSQVHTCVG